MERKSGSGTKSRSPGYMNLHESGELSRRAHVLEERLASCDLCPRRCGVNRRAGCLGACGVGAGPRVAAMSIHPWEEPPISGAGGSGTLFFSGCTLQCLYCQNYPISQMGVGRSLSAEDLAVGMLKLQRRGAHNINLVSSTHQMAVVVRALAMAVPMGLRIPLVYNSSGYETLDTLRCLEGVVDIYLPDIKYADPYVARRYSGRGDYVEANRAAVREMWRQVGPLQCDEEGIAWKGLMVRHLVLPADLSGTRSSLSFLAGSLGKEVWVSLMNQYFPAHKAWETPPLDRKVSRDEYEDACGVLADLELENGFVQDPPEDEDL